MQRTKAAQATASPQLTPSKLVAMIRMLPVEHQYRVLWNNPEALGQVLFLPKDGIPGNESEFLVCNTEANQRKAIDFKCQHMIGSAKNLSECFWHLNKPYRIQILQIVAPIYDMNGEYETILRDAWTSTEYPHQAKVDSLIDLFEGADRTKLMDDDEKAVMERLPDELRYIAGGRKRR